MKLPEPGDLVRYVLPGDSRCAGEVRGAIVSRSFAASGDLLNLTIFTDGGNDGPGYDQLVTKKFSVHEGKPDEAGVYPLGTWHRVPGVKA